MNRHLASLALLLTLLVGRSSAYVHRNQACSQFSVYGTCNKYYRMWFYSRVDNECFTFPYSGCGGNTNRFRTREDCLTACKRIK